MKLLSLAAVAFLAGSAYAQGITQCILTCSQTAATAAGCSSYTNATCVCTSASFQNAAGACLLANCTAAEQQSAVQLQAALCGAQSLSASGSVSVRLSSATGSTQLPTAVPSASGSASASVSSLVSGLSASASSVSSAIASASSSRASGDKVAELKMGAFALAGLVGAVGVAAGAFTVL